MDETILKFYHSTRQTPEVYHQKLSLIDQIFKCIQPYFVFRGYLNENTYILMITSL